MFKKFENEIKRLKKDHLYRFLKTVSGAMDAAVSINGKEVVLLSSNNYLGLTSHPDIKRAALDAIEKYGTGAGASRLISGNMKIHETLERKIADFKKCESSILFSTGYMANIGVITSLAGKGDLILSDELNHASIIDGCRLSEARTIIYPHKDTEQVKKILSAHKPGAAYGYDRNIYIITDGIFSMDGDIAPLPELLNIAKMFNAFLLVDDAHGTGVLGDTGSGICEHFGLNDDRIIQIGTFSKAFGSLGGFAAGSYVIIDYIKNKARSFIYTTAPPPSVCASCIAAIDIIKKDPSLKNRLWKNAARFKKGLISIGFDSIESQTQIIPIITKDSGLTMKFANALFEKGIYAPGIRPPTVPEKKSRIRTSVMSSHTEKQIDKALDVFESEGRRLNII